VTRGPLKCNSSLCTFLCLATISLVISLVLYISFVTDFGSDHRVMAQCRTNPTKRRHCERCRCGYTVVNC